MKANFNIQGLRTQRLLKKKRDIGNNAENSYEEENNFSKTESLQNAVL